MTDRDLWTRIVATGASATALGALQPIDTDWEAVTQDGLDFAVRRVSSLGEKRLAAIQAQRSVSAGNQRPNPFMPPEQELTVGPIPPSHTCLLNKYPVIEHHLLIITRAFESQEAWLTQADFAAAWHCLEQIDGLCFYNAGAIAGASQPHKHLQLVSLAHTPFSAMLDDADGDSVPGLAFPHAYGRVDSAETDPPLTLYACYQALLQRAKIDYPGPPPGTQQTTPYNVLFTRRWMLLVPRLQPQFRGIAINALGFAGSLFVRSDAQLRLIQEIGPLTILQNVTPAIDA